MAGRRQAAEISRKHRFTKRVLGRMGQRVPGIDPAHKCPLFIEPARQFRWRQLGMLTLNGMECNTPPLR
jgi:hypothetical protein